MNVKSKIAAAALTGALVIGGTSAAFAAGSGTGDGKADRIAVLCAHQDEIVPRLTERQGNITERISVLQEVSTKATASGHAKVAAKADKRIETLDARLTKVTDRIAKAPAWIAEHCS